MSSSPSSSGIGSRSVACTRHEGGSAIGRNLWDTNAASGAVGLARGAAAHQWGNLGAAKALPLVVQLAVRGRERLAHARLDHSLPDQHEAFLALVSGGLRWGSEALGALKVFAVDW